MLLTGVEGGGHESGVSHGTRACLAVQGDKPVGTRGEGGKPCTDKRQIDLLSIITCTT